MCLNPFIVVFEGCGCTAYRVMNRCPAAGDDLFGICVQSLYEAIEDEEIFEQIWDGKCPMHKYVDSVQLRNPDDQKANGSVHQHPLPRVPGGILRDSY